jgi:hypothetical protein
MVAAAAVASALGLAAAAALVGGGVAAAGAEATGAGGTAIGTGAVGSSLVLRFNVLSVPSGFGLVEAVRGLSFCRRTKKEALFAGASLRRQNSQGGELWYFLGLPLTTSIASEVLIQSLSRKNAHFGTAPISLSTTTPQNE